METSQISMEAHKQKKSCLDNKLFSSHRAISAQEEEFEFSSWGTPGSPTGSPADNFFFNGRLLPHAFPSQPSNTIHGGFTYSRSTSRTSSVSSRDSLISSRSNSTNSLNSRCSSARTSTSEASSGRRILLNHQAKVSKERYKKAQIKPRLTPGYGSSRRWQFITPVPVFSHQTSRSKKSGKVERTKKSKENAKDKASSKPWFGRRLFLSFVFACIECHAIKTSSTSRINSNH